MKEINKKGIVIGKVTDVILLAIAILLLIVALVTLFPGASNLTKGVSLQIKKPFCCDILGCKPAIQQATQNPSGGFPCTAFCPGVCG